MGIMTSLILLFIIITIFILPWIEKSAKAKQSLDQNGEMKIMVTLHKIHSNSVCFYSQIIHAFRSSLSTLNHTCVRNVQFLFAAMQL